MCTALTSRPANATNVPTTKAMLESPSNGGVMSLHPSGAAEGLSSTSQANMNKIRASAGTTVPKPTPMLLKPAVVFMPFDTTNVAAQKPTRTTVPMYSPLPARSARPKAVANAAAPKESNDGYSVTLFMKTSHVAWNPVRSPNASRTQTKIPPSWLVASSAETRPTGRRKSRAGIR